MPSKYHFTPEQKEEMVALYVGGSSAADIQQAYSIVGQSTIYKILHEYNVPLRTRKPGILASSNGKPEKVEVTEEVDERLPLDRPSSKKRFRVTLKVRLTFESDSMETAIAKAKGYNGFQEVLSVARVG